jgi:hypothetical protein
LAVALRYSYEIFQIKDDNEVFNKLKNVSHPVHVIVDNYINNKRDREFKHETALLMFPYDYDKGVFTKMYICIFR